MLQGHEVHFPTPSQKIKTAKQSIIAVYFLQNNVTSTIILITTDACTSDLGSTIILKLEKYKCE